MVHRRGVGATIAAVSLFSLLLVSNFAVLGAAQDRERLDGRWDAESRLYDSAQVLTGAVALSILDNTQAILSQGAFDCSNARALVSEEVAGLSTYVDNGPLKVSELVALSPDVKADDNLFLLSPFNGSGDGRLSLSLTVTASGELNGTGVGFSKSENHILNLPVRFSEILAFCTISARAVGDYLSRTSVTNCTWDAIGPAASAVGAGLAGDARRMGLTYSLSFQVESTPDCRVSFRSMVSQLGIEGPGGQFSVEAELGGLASIQVWHAAATG
ncbi:MAG: hypothetical protein OK404_01240 [Thaumarchaeota archaeon]|nr:hypothetical protein [Nitrososphaerota archaeon]